MLPIYERNILGYEDDDFLVLMMSYQIFLLEGGILTFHYFVEVFKLFIIVVGLFKATA